MCLAVPGAVVSRHDDELVVDFQGNRMTVSGLMTPDARPGDWVLVHAGFAITQLDEADARQTWDYLQQIESAEHDIADTPGG